MSIKSTFQTSGKNGNSSASSSVVLDELRVSDNPEQADQALDFLSQVTVTEIQAQEVDLLHVRRKVDLRLIPLLFLTYTMCWLDKAILNYAAIMGMPKDIGLKGNEFSNANTFFYVACTISELPTGLVLNKVSATKWMSLNIVLWGAATAGVAGANSYTTLLVARILVGIFEAAVAPCILLIISKWYTKSEQAPRFGFFYAGLGTGQIIGGLQSFGFQHVVHTSFEGWRIMFVTMGALTLMLGVWTFRSLSEDPMRADYLNEAEKVALLRHISENRTGVTNRRFQGRQAWDLLADIQIWWLVVITISICMTSGVTSSYSTTLLTSLGYSPKQAALLNAMSGIVSISSAVWSGIGIRLTGHRWAWIIILLVPSIVGAALMSFMPRSERAAILAGIYLVNTCTATLPIIYQWTAANIAGQTKRPLAMGFIAAAFGVASTIGPQTFRARDAPLYQPARLTVLISLSAGGLLVALLAWYYKCENARREKMQDLAGMVIADDWANLTDRGNDQFRYVY